MASRRHPEQGYKSCLGIMRLCKKHGNERVEAASQRALVIQSASYKTVKSILDNSLETQPLPAVEQSQLTLPSLENIRGSENYQ